MDGAPYPAARLVAPALRRHFSERVAAAGGTDQATTVVTPPEQVIEAIIDAAFWASLRREEGYAPKISLAFVPAEQARHPLLFERPLSLDARALVRIAPAVERAGLHLGVWPRRSPVVDAESLEVWGTTRTIPPYCFVLEVAGPGLLVIKHQREEGSKFVNVAVLEGDQV